MSKPEYVHFPASKGLIPLDPAKPELGEIPALVLVEERTVGVLLEKFVGFMRAVVGQNTKQLTVQNHKPINNKPWVLVPIMTGGIYFGTDLSKRLGQERIDHCFEPIKYKSYEGQNKTQGEVSSFDFEKYRNYNVILVDELYDTGKTMTELHKLFKEKLSQDSLLYTFVLFRKILRNKPQGLIEPTLVGLDVPDLWYIGCGLDHHGTRRYLPYLAAIPKDDESKKVLEDAIFDDDEYFKALCRRVNEAAFK